MIRDFRKPYRVKRKKSILKNRFFWIFILVLIIISGIIYLLFFSKFFKIKEIKVSGNREVSTNDISNIAKNILFYGSDNFLLIDREKIKKEISNSLPKIAKVDLKSDFPDKLIIEVKEREPIAVLNYTDKYFLIDKLGVIFKEINEIPQDILIINNPTLNRAPELGKEAINNKETDIILEINQNLKENLGISLTEITVISEERINAKTLEGWQIYFNTKSDINWQLTKLKAVLEEKLPPEKRGSLEYIDLRFGNFAPYK